MPGMVYENTTFSPGTTFDDGNIFVGCTFAAGTTFGEGCVFDGCTLVGCATGLGNVFGNKTVSCSFRNVVFGVDNILHEGWVNLGGNVPNPSGNYGLPGMVEIQKGVVETQCGSDSDLPDGVEDVILCLAGTDETYQDGITVKDRGPAPGP